jgi:HrpA-like RNA helicase
VPAAATADQDRHSLIHDDRGRDAALWPSATYPTDPPPIAQPRSPLPIEPALPALRAALGRGHAVLTAPTGSGKTTRVPLALLNEPWLAAQPS